MKHINKGVLLAASLGLCSYHQPILKPRPAYAEQKEDPTKSQNDGAIYMKQDLINNILKKEFSAFTEDQLTRVRKEDLVKYEFKVKTRQEYLQDLQRGEEYDLLIVGCGANGAGVVLDAASRGLKCAIIDKYDFASGTSCKSTKMAHGGIRYF